MPIYETVFMTRQDLTEAQVKDLTTQFSKILTQQGGKILKTEYWGLRALAYVINKSRRAHYVLLEYDASGAAVTELERNLRLHEDVVRSLSVKREEASKGPSALLEKSGRDDEEKEAA